MESIYNVAAANFSSVEADNGVDARVVAVAAGVSAVSLLSQIPIIPIGLGLEGNFSAKTLMVVQAVSEMVRRATATYLALCGSIGNFLSFTLR